ncbi:(transport protein particle) complex protein Trs85 [Pseudohyphozyma bogoriensis]|nr:(transport protein particle) complex protein Trs85 [Pseudohyphozyma bogoriensis]
MSRNEQRQSDEPGGSKRATRAFVALRPPPRRARLSQLGGLTHRPLFSPAVTAPPPTSTANALSPHFSPLVHLFTTPDLAPILARSSFPSLATLLAPFAHDIQRVAIRNSTYEAKTVPSFGVRFVERALPPSFGGNIGRSRSGTASLDAPVEPRTPSTPFVPPTQAERDELFLDSVSSAISGRVDAWIKDELKVKRPVKPKKRYPEEGEEEVPEPEVEPEGWEGKDVDEMTPWYKELRENVFRRREMVEWESFGWPVGCLLALSTSHPDPLNALSSLWDLTSKESLFAPTSYPAGAAPGGGGGQEGVHEWANPDVLRYVVLVHDYGAGGGQEGWEDARTLQETISKTYPHHVALLPLFSASPTAAKPQPRADSLATIWTRPSPSKPMLPPQEVGLGVSGLQEEVKEAKEENGNDVGVIGAELSEEDLKSLRMFLREMVVQSIVPFMERAVVVGNEQYTASKKGLGGRLFSAGRKYFGGSNASRSGSPVSATGSPLSFNAVKGFYPYAAQESQSRRLADLAFMIQDYKLAAAVYDSVSKDYKSDRAWRYYSSACRMAGLSLLLNHPPGTPLTFNPDVYLEQALQTPPLGGFDLDGLQSMMLYYEAYRIIGDWRPAPVGLIRTAGESEEITSAVLLEQAAISDLMLPLPSKRKYGFHMTMAAARYEKTGLKSLSRRCLSQASTLYRVEDPTPFLQDPRWTNNMRGWKAIRSHVHHSLGRQTYNVGKSDDAVEQFLELLVGAGDGEGGDDEAWLDDFGMAWEHLGPEGAARVVKERDLKLHVTIFDPKDAAIRVRSSGGVEGGEGWETVDKEFGLGSAVVEIFYLELTAVNPLDAPLAIGGLEIETDAAEGVVEVEPPQEIELGPRETTKIYVPVRATSLVTFGFTSVSFRFNDLLPCTETLISRSKPLSGPVGPDKTNSSEAQPSLKITIRSPVPILEVSLDQLPSELYAGEVKLVNITVVNAGEVDLVDLRSLCSHPSFALFLPPSPAVDVVYAPSQKRNDAPIKIPNQLVPNTPFSISLGPSNTLAPGASVTIPFLLRGDAQGSHTLKWLFGFRGSADPELLISRSSHKLEVLPSLDIRPLIRPGHSLATPFLIGLEISNTAVPADVVITEIASISPRWRCHALSPSDDQSEVVSLLHRQSANVFLGIRPASEDLGEDDGIAFTVGKLDDLLQGKDVKKGVPGDTNFYTGSSSSGLPRVNTTLSPLFSSLVRTHIQLRHRSLTNQLPTIPKDLHQYLFTLFNPRSIDLVVFWTVPSTGVQGHHHLVDIPLGAATNSLTQVLETAELKAGGLYAESQRERSTLLAGLRRSELGVDGNPIEVVIEVADAVDHDFDAGPCFVPVTFFVRNVSAAAPLHFTLLLQSSDTEGASTSSPTRLPYAGTLTHRGIVAPLGIERVSTQLWLSKAGNYDVGDWRVDATGPGTWSKIGASRVVRVKDVKAPRYTQSTMSTNFVPTLMVTQQPKQSKNMRYPMTIDEAQAHRHEQDSMELRGGGECLSSPPSSPRSPREPLHQRSQKRRSSSTHTSRTRILAAMDIDDDLLALAEGTSSKRTKKRSGGASKAPKRKRAASSESGGSDMDMSSDEELPRERKKAVGFREDASDDEGVSSLYPLEGKYKNEQDRAMILGMTEVEREEILAERVEAAAKERERKQLRQMVRSKNLAEGGIEADEVRTTGRDRKTTGVTDSKREGLEALKRKRAEKDNKKTSYKEDSDEDESPRKRKAAFDEYSDDGDSDEDAYDKAASKSSSKRGAGLSSASDELTPSEFRDLVVTRRRLAALCQAPWFEEWVTHAWVRVAVGLDPNTRESVYRLARVEGVVDVPEHSYVIEGTKTTVQLNLSIGDDIKRNTMEGISNSVCTDSEFIRLKKTLDAKNLPLPSPREAAKLKEALAKRTEYILTEADLAAALAKKGPRVNPAAGRAKLMIQRDFAIAQGNQELLASINADIAKLDAPAQRDSVSEAERMSQVNARNRATNREEIKRAEARGQEERMKQAKALARGDLVKVDPSARVKTMTRLKYDRDTPSRPSTPVPGTPTSGISTPTIAGLPKPKLSKNADVASTVDIELDLDF